MELALEEKKLEFEKKWKRKRRVRRLREQEVEKRAPSRPVGRGQLGPYQDLHSFISTSSRWREVKSFRKESEKRSRSELSIYTEVVCSSQCIFRLLQIATLEIEGFICKRSCPNQKKLSRMKGKALLRRDHFKID